jgi:hypothetical protein
MAPGSEGAEQPMPAAAEKASIATPRDSPASFRTVEGKALIERKDGSKSEKISRRSRRSFVI